MPEILRFWFEALLQMGVFKRLIYPTRDLLKLFWQGK